MADIDYTALAAEALGIVVGVGTTVTLLKLNNTPADPDKPWRGAADPRSPAAGSHVVAAVNVPENGIGKMISKKDIPDSASNFWFITPAATDPDFSDYDELVENDGTNSRIVLMKVLKPADTVLLYVVGTQK